MRVPIVQRFHDVVQERGDDVGIICGDETRTFAAVDRASNRLARAYADRGVGTGDIVTIALPNSVEFVEALLAVWKLGAVPLPISWQLPGRERDQIIELADPRLVVGVTDLTTVHPWVAPGFAPEPDLDDGPLPIVVSPNLRAMTSGGSTGRPKLIVATEDACFDFERTAFPVSGDAVQLVAGPMYHTAPFSYGVLGFVTGQRIVVLPRFDAAAALTAIAEHRVTTAMVVPTMLLRMARAIEDGAAHDLGSVHALWHTGGPCPAWLKERWIELVGGDHLFELYGSTESIATCMISGTEWLAHKGSVGRPIIGEMKVCDPMGEPSAPGEIGEIYMRRGPDAASPYRYVGAATRSLPGGWESLGDLGYTDAEGYFFLSDRRTDLIVSGGANVFPAEVEGVIGEHPGVVTSAVVGLPDGDLGQRVHAVVHVSADGAVDVEDLRAFVAERLVRYKVPRSFRLTTEPLHNEAGKVRRSLVLETEIERVSGRVR